MQPPGLYMMIALQTIMGCEYIMRNEHQTPHRDRERTSRKGNGLIFCTLLFYVVNGVQEQLYKDYLCAKGYNKHQRCHKRRQFHCIDIPHSTFVQKICSE